MKSRHLQLVGTATLGPKGQVVIPAEVREKMGITAGDKLIALYVEDKQAVAFVTEAQVQSIVNKFDEHIGALRSAIKPINKQE